MNNEKFVILTATYNSGKYLKDWASSIVQQTYRPIDVILVNDKSTDDTLRIVNEISKKFEKSNISFKFFNLSKKLYCGGAYALALRKCEGAYFGVLDADDMLEPFACEYVVEIYKKNPEVCWIYTQHNKYNRRMDRIIKKGFCCHPGKGRSILSEEKKGKQIYSHWRTFSNRFENNKKIFSILFKNKLKCCVDKNLGYRLEESGIGMFVDKVCYRFRRRNKKEKSISFFYPLRSTKESIIKEAECRRKKIKIYPIKEYKG